MNESESTRLAAEQAYSTRLREALEFGTDLYDDTKNQRDLTMALYEWVNTARQALALPHDDTARKQYGAKLLRDAARSITKGLSPKTARENIHHMADELEKKP